MPLNPNIYKAVVRVLKSSGVDQHQSLGSGVVFTSNGLLITNNHVIEESDFGTAFGDVEVELLEDIEAPPAITVRAELLIRHEVHDLAVLRMIDPPPVHFINILGPQAASTSLLEKRIRVLGYPSLGGSSITVTRGIVSGFDSSGNLKTDAEINPGNSGGAAFDDLDTFLGIPSFIVAEEHGKLGFIITVDQIRKWLTSALKSGLPNSQGLLETAFDSSNLNFSALNLDQSNAHPQILGKFAAVETLLAKREYQQVLPQIDFILKKRPRSALAYHYMGNAHLEMGRYVEAAVHFKTALFYKPSHIPALGNYGVTLIYLDRDAEALRIFETIIDLSDNPAELWAAYRNMGRIYENRKRPELAETYHRQAVQLEGAAAERLAQYSRPVDPNDKIAKIANAIVSAEIEIEKKRREHD